MKRTALLAAALLIGSGAAHAEMSDGVIKIGVLNDRSGLYADLSGEGSVIAARMAAEQFGNKINGVPIEIVSADHQNKPDVGSAIARRWYDEEKVDAIADVPTSSVALAVNEVTREKKRMLLLSGPGSADLTGAKCSPNTVHFTYDNWALAHGTGTAIVKAGGNTWFFITADYAFGHDLEKQVADVVRKAGGKVVGDVKVPLNTSDFSSYLLQAQTSKAKIIGLANAGGDTINSIKQAAEFGIMKGGQKLAGLLVFISDIHSLGLPTAGGLQLTSAFYWDMNDQTRAWSKQFATKNGGKEPTMVQAGVYSAVHRYLDAVKAAGTDASDKVMAQMKGKPWKDPLFGEVSIRADGRAVHDMYLFEVKTPAESKGPWDYYKLVQKIPAAEAFRPLSEGKCSLVKG
jgi:branched-chain amino acid transport system substrate-binding protein